MYTILQLVLIDETGDSYYRMRWPGATLSEQDSDLKVINLDAQAKERLELAEEVDLLILYQSNDLDLLPVIRKRKEKGLKTIVEYNDNFYAPPPASPVFQPWSSPLMWDIYERILLEADHITVTGQGLYDLFSKYAEAPISILKNQLPSAPDSFDTVWDTHNEFRIGWAGSIGHMGDLLGILPVLEKFCLTHENAILCLMGNESIPSRISLPESKIRFTPWGGMDEYYQFLESIHIGIAPLHNTPYNRCRSDVKALEYASRGALPIVQNLLPYAEVISSNIAKPFETAAELYNLLEQYITHRDSLTEDAKLAFKEITQTRLSTKNTERLDLYKSLLPSTPQVVKSSIIKELPAGYHEVQGTKHPILNIQIIASEVEKLLSENKIEQAQKEIEKHKDLIEDSSSLKLLQCKVLMNLQHPQTEDVITSGKLHFRHDLRFLIMLAQSKRELSDRVGVWLNIFEHLESKEQAVKTFFESQVVKSFINHLLTTPDLVLHARPICDLYPNNAVLMESVAQQAFKHSLYETAQSYSKRAIELFESKKSDQLEERLKVLRTLEEASSYARTLQY